MSSPHSVSDSSLEGLYVSLKVLHHSVSDLPGILDEEENAVTLHDIGLLEEILERKKSCGDVLHEAGHRCRELYRSLNTRTSASAGDGSMSQIVRFLKEADAEAALSTRGRHLVRVSLNLAEKVLKIFTEHHLRIQRNHLIVSKLLQNHQDSYRFWNQLIREKNSRYDEKGAVKDLQKVSQIRIEA